MKRTRILALLLAVVVMLMMSIILLPQNDNKEEDVATQNVIVAKQDIPAYTEITEEMLELAEYPENLVPADAVTEMEAAVGNKTLTEISQKEVLMNNHLFSEGDTNGGLALTLDAGMRAMSVSVDSVSGVSNLLKVGNKVDVIVVLQTQKSESTANEAAADGTEVTDSGNVTDDGVVSRMLLENIEIVALDSTLEGNPVDESGEPYYSTVTLSVTPQDAVKLAFSSYEGTVYLIERAQNDEEIIETSAVRINDIIG